MTERLPELIARAIHYARANDYGPDALAVNHQIADAAPKTPGVWTRLARCYLVSGLPDDASACISQALALNPHDTIAQGLRAELARQRAFDTGRDADVCTAFGPGEFRTLYDLPLDHACEALKGRFHTLFAGLNSSTIADKVVERRRRAGQQGTRFFHGNSYYPGNSRHIFAYHYGGRWEPQFNLGIYSGLSPAENCFRIGIGFNVSLDGRSPNPEAGQERVLGYFSRFQQVLCGPWGSHLRTWMERSGGFLQFDGQPPLLDWLPDRAIIWVRDCRNVLEHGWVFIGRWLFLERGADRAILSDQRLLTKAATETFLDLLPVWQATYLPAP